VCHPLPGPAAAVYLWHVRTPPNSARSTTALRLSLGPSSPTSPRDTPPLRTPRMSSGSTAPSSSAPACTSPPGTLSNRHVGERHVHLPANPPRRRAPHARVLCPVHDPCPVVVYLPSPGWQFTHSYPCAACTVCACVAGGIPWQFVHDTVAATPLPGPCGCGTTRSQKPVWVVVVIVCPPVCPVPIRNDANGYTVVLLITRPAWHSALSHSDTPVGRTRPCRSRRRSAPRPRRRCNPVDRRPVRPDLRITARIIFACAG